MQDPMTKAMEYLHQSKELSDAVSRILEEEIQRREELRFLQEVREELQNSDIWRGEEQIPSNEYEKMFLDLRQRHVELKNLKRQRQALKGLLRENEREILELARKQQDLQSCLQFNEKEILDLERKYSEK